MKTSIFERLRRFVCIILIGGFMLLPVAFSAAQSTEKQAITQKDYENAEIEMADEWRANGKIYVVVATIGILLTGIFAYLILLDRRVSKMERSINDK